MELIIFQFGSMKRHRFCLSFEYNVALIIVELIKHKELQDTNFLEGRGPDREGDGKGIN